MTLPSDGIPNVTYLGGEQHAADDLEDVVSPGAAGVRPNHGHQVADAEDGHYNDQGLGEYNLL